MVRAYAWLAPVQAHRMAEGWEERCNKANTLNWHAASEGPRSQEDLSNSYIRTETSL